MIFDENTVEIVGPVEAFRTISEGLGKAHIHPDEAGLRMLPKNEIELGSDATIQVMRTIESLEDLDDVQDVFSNLNISEEALAKMEAE